MSIIKITPAPYAPSDLSPTRFEFLLALTGFGEVWDAIAQQAKNSGDRSTYAALMAERKRSVFKLDRVLVVVEQFRDQAATAFPDVDLSEKAIRDAWKQAETYKGL